MKNIKLLVSVLSMLLFVTGCETIGSGEIANEDLNESVEMEEFILAGLDLQHSLNEFKQELNGVDMLSLTSALDSRGNMVIYIPTQICIEEKAKDFNSKKKALLEKHPELKNMKSVKRLDHIKAAADNSLKIAKAIMDFEFSNQPRLRPGVAEVGNYGSEADAFAFLDQQLSNPDYVEVVLIVFVDGTAMTYIMDDFTASSCYYPHMKKVNDKWYLSSSQYPKQVQYVGHTHQVDPNPSDDDLEPGGYIGLEQVIYTSGGNKKSYYTL